MSEFEKWFKTTEAYKMLEEQNYFKMDLFFFVGARNQYRHSGVQVAYLTWQHQKAKINEFEKNHAKAILKLDSLNAIIHTAENLHSPETSESVCLILDDLMSILRGHNESKPK